MRRIFLLFVYILFFDPMSLAQMPDSCGLIWSPIQRISNTPYQSVPVGIVATDSSVIVLWWSIHQDTSYYAISTDRGNNWTQHPVYMGPYAHTGSFITSSGSYVYIIWERGAFPVTEAVMMRSSNYGKSWEVPRIILPVVSAVGSYANYVFALTLDSLTLSQSRVARSTDYGDTWTILPNTITLRRFAPTLFHLHGIDDGAINGHEVAYYRSSDYGNTWAMPLVLSTIDQYVSQSPTLVADSVVRVFAAWDDRKYGGVFAGTILFRRSDDSGSTWHPENQLSSSPYGSIPTMATAGSYLHVGWSAHEALSSAGCYHAFSKDLGTTWCRTTKVTEGLQDGDDLVIGATRRDAFFAWRTQNQIYVRKLIPQPTAVAESSPTHSDQEIVAYPNPFNATTTIRLSVKRRGRVQVTLFTLLGEEIGTLLDEEKQPGEYQVTWNQSSANLNNHASGIYFTQVSVAGERRIIKLISLK